VRKTLLLALFLTVSCGKEESLRLIPGPKGDVGANGHSLVSLVVEANEIECDEQGGRRLDIFLDNDDSLNVSEGDMFQSSLISCNGLNGLNGLVGETGAQGPQ
jgi:hypothetical protein